MDVQQLVRNVTWRLARRPPRPTGEVGWHFGAGVSLWVNPEVRCPWCDTGVPTGRVWALDEARGKMLRVWTLDGQEIENREKWHPHVFVSTGGVCLGDADTVAEALWMGLNPADNRANPNLIVKKWLEEMGHPCVAQKLTYMPDGEEDEDDHDGESLCDRCDEWHNEDYGSYCSTADRWYCDDCWAETHDRCEDCQEWVLTDSSSSRREYMTEVAGGDRVCEQCHGDNYFTCDGCSDVHPVDDMREGPSEYDNYCESCHTNARAVCDSCSEEGWKDDLDGDGLCGECAEKVVCEECEGRVDELLCREVDGPQVCHRCFYGDLGQVAELQFEEVQYAE